MSEADDLRRKLKTAHDQLKVARDEIEGLRSRLAISRHISTRYGDLIEAHIAEGANLFGRVAAVRLAATDLNRAEWCVDGNSVSFRFPEVEFKLPRHQTTLCQQNVGGLSICSHKGLTGE